MHRIIHAWHQNIHPFADGNGRVSRLLSLQVKDYSKYDMAGFSEEHKKAVHDAEFPAMLDQAFKIGAGE